MKMTTTTTRWVKRKLEWRGNNKRIDVTHIKQQITALTEKHRKNDALII